MTYEAEDDASNGFEDAKEPTPTTTTVGFFGTIACCALGVVVARSFGNLRCGVGGVAFGSACGVPACSLRPPAALALAGLVGLAGGSLPLLPVVGGVFAHRVGWLKGALSQAALTRGPSATARRGILGPR